MRELTKLFRDVEDVGKGQKKAEKFERLFESGIPKIAKKVGEEGVEIAVAAMSPKGRKKLVARESADLLCYLCALWVELGITEEKINEALVEARLKFGPNN